MKRLMAIAVMMTGLTAGAQLFPNLGGQRVGVSTLTFLKNDMNPISLGLGGATVAMKNNPYGMNMNPASIVDNHNWEISLSDLHYGMNINQAFLSVKFPISAGQIMAVSVNNLSTGPMDVRTEFQPQGTGEKYYVQSTSIGAAYSRFLSSKFSFGLTLKYYYERLAQYTNHTAGFDLGFLYRTEWNDLNFAVSVRNFGASSSLTGDFMAETFNRDTALTDKYTLPTTFSMGVSMMPINTPEHKLYTAIQLDHPNDNAENLRFGVQYQFKERFSARMGYMLNVDDHSWPTFGLGYDLYLGVHDLRINYAVDITNFMGTRHLFGLSLSLNKWEKRE